MARNRSTFGRVLKRAGRPGFYVRIRSGAKEVTRWAGPDRKTANEVLADLLRKAAREDLLGERVIPAVSFAEFEPVVKEHFRAHHSPTTFKGETGRLKRVVDWFGKTALKDISAGEFQDFLTDLRIGKNKLSVAAVNRYASLLSVAMKLAVQKGYAVENPMKNIKRGKEAERPVPYVSGENVESLVTCAADARFGAMLRVFADTGLRRSEALRLEWRDVDFTRGTLLVRESKSGRSRHVELTHEATEAFRWLLSERKTLPMKGPDLVWPEWTDKRAQAVSSRFKTVAKRAGLDQLRLHDLRHAFCSRLAQAGVPLANIAKLAGHSTWLTTQRYASHVPEGAGRDAIRRMEANERAPVETHERKAEGDL